MIEKKLKSFIENYLKNNGLTLSNWNVSINTKEGFGPQKYINTKILCPYMTKIIAYITK